jgi:PPK2 family polyphosphate:nucleotide phosphotransferase
MRWHARMPLMAQAKQGKSESKQDKKSAKVKKTEKATSKAIPAKAAAKATPKAETARTAEKVEKAAQPAEATKVAKASKATEVAKTPKTRQPAAAKTAKTAAAEAGKAVETAEVAKATKTRQPAVAKTAKTAEVVETAEVAKATKTRQPAVAKTVKTAKTAKVAKTAQVAAADAEPAVKTVAAVVEPAQPAESPTATSATAAAEKAAKADARKVKEEFKAAKAAARAALKAEDRELEPAQAKKFVEQVAAEIIAADAASAKAVLPTSPLTELLRLKPGAPVDLAAFDPRATPGVETRAQSEAQLAVLAARVGELQERLYAAAVGGDSKRRVLLVLQGMDTSGKGGTVRHVAGLLDPNGTRIKAFKAPTPEELEHDFLWRIRENAPVAGQIGIFDRSQYEDVLVAKVRKLALPMHIGRRYGSINKFEKSLADDGCVVVKCFLHISPEEQRERLLARLDDPHKHWKYNPTDVDDRLLWPDFQEAYRIALERCGTEAAPWHVIPADRKWYRNYAVLRLLIEALESIDPQYPAGHFDLAAERARVLAS